MINNKNNSCPTDIIKITNNSCPICLDNKLECNSNPRLSKVEVFICGHGVCIDCYPKMNLDAFKCPICRNGGQKYLLSFGSSNTSQWNTLYEWYIGFETALLMHPKRKFNTGFGKIYSDLKDQDKIYKKLKKENIKKAQKLKKKKELHTKRKIERDNAQCDKCGTMCTSFAQLNLHKKGSKCKKLQRKQYNN